MRLVITGALGHIGSRLVRDLPVAFPEAEIVMVDDLSTQRHCSLFDLPANGRYRFLERDVLQADLAAICRGADAVVHLAAITDAVSSVERREEVERVNFAGTGRVADACARIGAPLLFVSTTSVYGASDGTVDEDCTDLKPQSPYAASKLAAERLLAKMSLDQGLRHVSCRFGTIFGISPGMRFHTAINKFCWQAANGLPVTVWRTAMDQQRPYLDLGDAVEAIAFVLRRRLFSGALYNVVTVNASVREVLDALSPHAPRLDVELVDTPIMNQLSYRVSSERLGRLGFSFRGDLARGIAETMAKLRRRTAA